MRKKVSARQPLEKAFQVLAGRRRERAQVFQNLVLSVDMKSLVEVAIQMIGSGDVKLPNNFGFPRRESFRINRFDVRVSQETEHLQSFRRFYLAGKSSHRFRIKNVAPQRRAHFQMPAYEE